MKRRLTGIVVSDKMEKAIVVSVESVKTHPLYRKKFKTHQKFIAREVTDEKKIGDIVTIEETRPLSKRIRWQVIEEGVTQTSSKSKSSEKGKK
ncbi:MAG: 30S ribosomal protein S17 [Bacteriovoracaceae bacterium]